MSAAQKLAASPAPYIAVPQLAKIIGCDQRTIRRMIEDGHLRAVRVGRCYRIPIEHARARFTADQQPAA